MGVVKIRGAARKLGSIGLGRDFSSFKVRNCKRHFTVHEDLLCTSSKFFKQKLQKKRKAIEGECSICSEDLDPKVDDITFCRAECGQNIHIACMDKWKTSHPRVVLRCPMCRKPWKRNLGDAIEIEEDLPLDAVLLYIDWLYSGQLHLAFEDEDGNENFCLTILKAWKVSSVLEDNEFRYALIAKYLTAQGSGVSFGKKSLTYAFEEENVELMREFIADAFRTYVPDDMSSDWINMVPAAFLHQLIMALLKSQVEKQTRQNLLAKHTENSYAFEADNDSSEEEEEEEEEEDDTNDNTTVSDNDIDDDDMV